MEPQYHVRTPPWRQPSLDNTSAPKLSHCITISCHQQAAPVYCPHSTLASTILGQHSSDKTTIKAVTKNKKTPPITSISGQPWRGGWAALQLQAGIVPRPGRRVLVSLTSMFRRHLLTLTFGSDVTTRSRVLLADATGGRCGTVARSFPSRARPTAGLGGFAAAAAVRFRGLCPQAHA